MTAFLLVIMFADTSQVIPREYTKAQCEEARAVVEEHIWQGRTFCVPVPSYDEPITAIHIQGVKK